MKESKRDRMQVVFRPDSKILAAIDKYADENGIVTRSGAVEILLSQAFKFLAEVDEAKQKIIKRTSEREFDELVQKAASVKIEMSRVGR